MSEWRYIDASSRGRPFFEDISYHNHSNQRGGMHHRCTGNLKQVLFTISNNYLPFLEIKLNFVFNARCGVSNDVGQFQTNRA